MSSKTQLNRQIQELEYRLLGQRALTHQYESLAAERLRQVRALQVRLSRVRWPWWRRAWVRVKGAVR